MKVKYCDGKEKFRPICITIETLEEFEGLYKILNDQAKFGTPEHIIWDKLDDFASENDIEV